MRSLRIILPGVVLFVAVTIFSLSCSLPVYAVTDSGDRVVDTLKFAPLDFKIQYPQKFKLSNGIQVYFKQDSELPLVDVTVAVAAGKVGVPNKKTGLSQLLAMSLRSGGAGKWDADQLDQRLDDLAAGVRVSSSAYTTDFHMSLLSEDANSGLEVLAAMVQKPRFSPKRFAIARQQVLESIRRRGDSPASIARLLMMNRLYAGHPLADFTTKHSVESLTVADLQRQYERYFGPANARIVISGALTKAQASSLLEQSFGSWKVTVDSQVVPKLSNNNYTETVVVDRPVPQTTVLMTQLGIEKSNPDLYAIQVMNYILGGGGFSSRLMREVRSNRGLAYSVYSYFSVGRRLRGPFLAGCETKNSSVAEVVELMRTQIKKMRNTPVTRQELQQAQSSLINSFIFAFSDSHALSTRIMEQEMYGYPEDYLEHYRQRISEVTIADVQRVATKYMQPQRQLLILVGDKHQLQPALQQLGGDVEEVKLESLL